MSVPRSASLTFPRLAITPSLSKGTPNRRSHAASIIMLPGPVSQAKMPDASPCGSAVTLPMPPRLRRTTFLSGSPYRICSEKGTSGAPWPPAAISALRKSDTTHTECSRAMTAGSPSWSVPAHQSSEGYGSCHTVCPWLATKASSESATPAMEHTFSTARENRRPSSKFKEHNSREELCFGSHARSILFRVS